jgi:hypothetical protein
MAAAAARAWYLALMVMRSKNAKYNCDERREGEDNDKTHHKQESQLEILELELCFPTVTRMFGNLCCSTGSTTQNSCSWLRGRNHHEETRACNLRYWGTIETPREVLIKIARTGRELPPSVEYENFKFRNRFCLRFSRPTESHKWKRSHSWKLKKNSNFGSRIQN